MPENNDQIKLIKIPSNEDELTVSFDPKSEIYTFKSRGTGLVLSFDEGKISNLISFCKMLQFQTRYIHMKKEKRA